MLKKTPLKSKSTLKAKTILKSKSSLKPKKAIKRGGKKTDEWAEARKNILRDFESRGIISCELRLSGCLGNLFLSLAHSRKRRNIKTAEDLYEVVLACQNCHEIIEYSGIENMYTYVKEAIRRRS